MSFGIFFRTLECDDALHHGNVFSASITPLVIPDEPIHHAIVIVVRCVLIGGSNSDHKTRGIIHVARRATLMVCVSMFAARSRARNKL